MFPILGMSAYERYSDDTLSSRSVGGGWISDQFWHARPIVGVLQANQGRVSQLSSRRRSREQRKSANSLDDGLRSATDRMRWTAAVSFGCIGKCLMLLLGVDRRERQQGNVRQSRAAATLRTSPFAPHSRRSLVPLVHENFAPTPTKGPLLPTLARSPRRGFKGASEHIGSAVGAGRGSRTTRRGGLTQHSFMLPPTSP